MRKKKAEEKQSEAFYVRFTPQEAKVLRRIAKKYGSIASFIRASTIEQLQILNS